MKIFWFVVRWFVGVYRGIICVCIIWKLIGMKITFAFITIIVRSNCLLLQKILYHFYDLSIITIIEIQWEIPSIVECNRLIPTVTADYFGKDLTCEVVAYYWILSLFVVVPPLLALIYHKFTIYCRLFFVRSAFNYLYFGFFDLFNYRLRSYSKANKNYWESCCP
jgi:hypothetical protein